MKVYAAITEPSLSLRRPNPDSPSNAELNSKDVAGFGGGMTDSKFYTVVLREKPMNPIRAVPNSQKAAGTGTTVVVIAARYICPPSMV